MQKYNSTLEMDYPDFVTDKQFFKLHKSKSEMEQVLGLSQNLKRIQHLTSTNFGDFNKLVIEYLEIGLEIFDMKIGIVSKINGNTYEIVDAVTPDGSLKQGDIFDLEDTYCREVCNSNNVLGFPNVGKLEKMKDHPVYVNMKLESYISAPIYVQDRLFGTFNFTSTEPRAHGFSEHERDLITLMARSIGNFLELKEKESDLKSTSDRMRRLVGYVVHDLRNPLTNVLHLSKLIGEPHSGEKIAKMIGVSARKGLEIVTNVLETAAMGTGKIELQRKKVDVSKLIHENCDKYKELFVQDGLSFSVSCEPGLHVELDPHRMDQVLTNLLSNALKYTSENGTIEVTAKVVEDKLMLFEIKNSVGAIRLKHAHKSVGFGLEIVREILNLHQSKLSVDRDSSYFHASFMLDLHKSIETTRKPVAQMSVSKDMPKTERSGNQESL